ncbi:MAG: WD40 repeat domain-containing protein [Gemmataceae bacterium]
MARKSAPTIEMSPFTCYPTPILQTFGDLRYHPDGELQALAFAADGTLWSIEEPGKLRQWDTSSGAQVISQYLSDTETLWLFSDDAKLIASAADELSLWDAATGRLLTGMPQPSWVTALAFGPEGRLLATGHDDGIPRVWDTTRHQLVHQFQKHRLPVSAIAFSPEGDKLVSAGEDRTISLWDLKTGQQIGTFDGHTDRIQALAWHPNGQIVVSAGWDTTARIWDVSTFQPIILLNGHADQVTALTFSPDGSLLACADSENAVHIWDPLAGKALCVLREHEDEVRALAFSADGNLLASGGADRVIKLWDPRKSQPLARTGSTLSLRSSLAVSPDGKCFASTGTGGGLQLFDTRTAKPLPALSDGEEVQEVTFSPDGKWIIGGGVDRRIHVWEAATGKLVRSLLEQKGRVSALAFSPDSKTFASGSASDGMVWLFKIDSGEPLLVIPEAADNCVVDSLVFHPEGKLLAAGGIDWMSTSGSDGAVCLWDLSEPGRIAILDGGTACVAFHPAGKLLATGSLHETVYVWDLDSQDVRNELTGHSGLVTAVTYSPDGRFLVSASTDRTIRFWNSDNGESAAIFGFDTQIKALAFSPDGRFLFTNNGNTTCYQLEVAKLLEEA